MGVPENLDALMVLHDIPASSIARAAGVSEATVSGWRKGAQPRKANLEKLCDYFGITEDDILSDSFGLAAREHGRYGAVGQSNQFVNVPLLGSISAGKPIDMMGVDEKFPAPLPIIKQHPDAFFLRVEGDSVNRKIPNGYVALIDPNDRETNEHDIYAVCVNGYSATLKHVRKLANGYELVPDSYDPTQRPIVFDYGQKDTDEITIIGKVIWAAIPFDVGI